LVCWCESGYDNFKPLATCWVVMHERTVVSTGFLAQAASCERLLRRPRFVLSEWASRLSEIPRELLFPFFEPSPRRRGLAWARPFSLNEELGEAVWLRGCFWNSEMGYACLDVDYCVKCMRQINMHEWCDSWIVNDGLGVNLRMWNEWGGWY